MRHLPFIHYSLSFFQIQTGAVSFLLPASSFLDELFLLLIPCVHTRFVHFLFPLLWTQTFFFFLVGLKLGWKCDWMEGQRKKHIQRIICKISFCRHNIAIIYSNTVIDMQKVFTDSCADPSAKMGFSSLFMQCITHNDFVPFSTFTLFTAPWSLSTSKQFSENTSLSLKDN